MSLHRHYPSALTSEKSKSELSAAQPSNGAHYHGANNHQPKRTADATKGQVRNPLFFPRRGTVRHAVCPVPVSQPGTRGYGRPSRLINRWGSPAPIRRSCLFTYMKRLRTNCRCDVSALTGMEGYANLCIARVVCAIGCWVVAACTLSSAGRHCARDGGAADHRVVPWR